MSWSGPNGIQTSPTVLAARNLGIYRNVIIQNQSASATLYIKIAGVASSSVWDFTLPAGTLPVFLQSIPDHDSITAYSTDLKYSVTAL